MLQTFREWALSQLGDDALERLSSFTFSHTFSLEGHRVTVVHASPKSTEDWYDASSSDAELTPILEGVESDILVCGHIHTPYARRIGTRWVINAGSVGQPVDGDARASYLLLEADRGGLNVQIRRVPYDVEAAVDAAGRGDFPYASAYAEAIRAGKSF